MQYIFNLIGNAVLQNIWQAAILYSVYYIVAVSIKNKIVVYWIAVSLQIIVFGLFINNFFTQQTRLNKFSFLSVSHNDVEILLNTIGQFSLLFITVKVIQFIVKANRLFQISTFEEHQFDLSYYNKIVNQFLPNKKAVIKIAKTATNPFTYGFLKPVIILPMSFLNSLTPLEMELIVMHELAHILRKDFLVNLVMQVIETLLCFNPFVILLSKAIDQEREYCCDDWVLNHLPQQNTYANLLFIIAKKQQYSNAVLAQNFAKPFYLLNRIKRILRQKQSLIVLPIYQIVFFVFICLISLIFSNKKEESKIVVQKTNVALKVYIKNEPKKAIILKTKALNKERIPKENTTKVSLKKKEKYTSKDRLRFKEGLQFLSEIAKNNVAILQLLKQNPSIQQINLKENNEQESNLVDASLKESTEKTRYFYIPANSKSEAKIITIKVVDKDNKEQKVIIEIETLSPPKRA